MLTFLKNLFLKQEVGIGLDLERSKISDPRNFRADVLGAWFGEPYKPAKKRHEIKLHSVKNQFQQNTCVAESGLMQKEVDEQTVLSAQWMATYMKSKGMMNENGATLADFQYCLKKVGCAEKRFGNDSYFLPWDRFSDEKILTQESFKNAEQFLSGSYWITHKTEVVLEFLDQNKVFQTGGEWFHGYNPSQLKAPFILNFGDGRSVGGHAFVIVGYDLNYNNESVFICRTSWGNTQYDDGRFYIRFKDFNKICRFGGYFNLDIERDLAGWLAKNATKAIKELNSPKVWIIEGDKKRYIPNEALMWMLEVTPSDLTVDTENMLPLLKEGKEMSLADIPEKQIEKIKYFLALTSDQAFMKERFAPFFPELFK